MFEDIRGKADLVRHIDLVEVLKRAGGRMDHHDSAKWHTCQGVISVTGQKFINWTKSVGGGGAIDLVMHLKQWDFKSTLSWLLDMVSSPAARSPDYSSSKPTAKGAFILPERDDRNLPQVIDYLRYNRCIPTMPVNVLIRSGKLYADKRGNAVFLLLGKEKKVVGAELRGTNHSRWHGMAPGSRKGLGAFYVKSQHTQKIVLCESAIDALSYFALYPGCMAASTSGANPNPTWLSFFIAGGFEIYCGFDNDEAGEQAADKMICLYPMVRRLKPIKHDWNEVLRSQ
jgi:hypothetical protein